MLNKEQILEYMEKGLIDINPFSIENLGPNSYDLCLGNTFFELMWDERGPLYVGPQVYLVGERVAIPSGSTILAHTMESIKTPNNIVGKIFSRSTTAKTGLKTVGDAGLGDLGFEGPWTLELGSNVRVGTPSMVIGSRIAQICFFETRPLMVEGYKGQYARKTNCEWPWCMIPKDYRDRVVKTHSKLLALK